MGNWLERLLPKEVEPASTAALDEAFLRIDAALSKAQAVVDEYRALTPDGALDASWAAVRGECERCTEAYLSLAAPGARLARAAVDDAAGELLAAGGRADDFRGTAVAALDAERRVVEAEGAERARKEAQEAARATRLAAQATNALSSVSTRLQAARTRLEGVAPAMSALYREFVAASSADLVGGGEKALAHLGDAADYLAHGRSSLRNGDAEGALSLAASARAALCEADRLIDAAPRRLQELRALRDGGTWGRSKRTLFALRDAQMFAVDHGLAGKWGPALDAQLERVKALEAALSGPHPDYRAYANGLDEVEDSIQSVVARMRAGLRGACAPTAGRRPPARR